MAGLHTRTPTRTGTAAGSRTWRRRVVLTVAAAALATLAVAGACRAYGALAAQAAPRAPHSSTVRVPDHDGGSGRRLWSVFKHLWTNADGRRTPTVVSGTPPRGGTVVREGSRSLIPVTSGRG
ncbi:MULTISPECIES: hypothetical protein [Streptomyces]|uniref:Uncharacterized protein n=1 Tax=Streptomyces spororaveus TaxID=284039 RepID=A0ABQ3TGN9_9ACTN|nr:MULTISPECIES: hypothetical protein [Streptomyces]MCM9080131.1 hypothetical protein [Streptomyces spororaveus]MCX5305463.1 hypothetical protein [Streptomyces sp. NBC_00160]GHI79551.1 hypothetical protein Sspor_51120 [Streptomyces spororaveus]